MSHFKFISSNEKIKPILRQLELNKEYWKAVWNFEKIAGDKTPPGFLPLVMAVVEEKDDDPKDTEMLFKTPMFAHFTAILKWLESKHIQRISRCAFFKLAPGGTVGTHVDEGTYYLKKDRYHLSLQGEYEYTVGEETHLIKPGTFFWFNNKIPHSAKNVAKVDRITFVFDVPHSPNNPHYNV